MAKTPALQKCIDCNREGDKLLFYKGGNGRCNKCSKIEWEKNNPDRLRSQRPIS